MRWITRQNVKLDRVACPWLIKRFIDPRAELLFVPEEELLERSRQEDAISFHAIRFSEVRLNHRGERCTFEAILEDYMLTDPALHRFKDDGSAFARSDAFWVRWMDRVDEGNRRFGRHDGRSGLAAGRGEPGSVGPT